MMCVCRILIKITYLLSYDTSVLIRFDSFADVQDQVWNSLKKCLLISRILSFESSDIRVHVVLSGLFSGAWKHLWLDVLPDATTNKVCGRPPQNAPPPAS